MHPWIDWNDTQSDTIYFQSHLQLSPHSKAKPTSQFTNESKIRFSCSLMQPLIAKKTRHSLKSSSNYQSKLDMEFRCNNDGRERVCHGCAGVNSTDQRPGEGPRRVAETYHIAQPTFCV